MRNSLSGSLSINAGGLKAPLMQTLASADRVNIGVSASRYDLIIVFPYFNLDDSQKVAELMKKGKNRVDEVKRQAEKREEVCVKLNRAGLHTKLFFSKDKDEVFCKIGADIERLREEAARMGYKLQLKQEPPYFGAYTAFEKDSVGSKEANFKDAKRIEHLFKRQSPNLPEKEAIFSVTDRIHLIDHIIRSKTIGCAGIDMGRLLKDKDVSAYFPLHEKEEIGYFNTHWVKAVQAVQPIHRVRAYFGEKIALYFAWLGFYTSWLWAPAIIGFIVFLAQRISDTPDNWTVVPFCFFMAMWSTLFLEYWKRYNSKLATEWGTYGFEDNEQPRPEFIGDKRISPINDRPELYYSPKRRLKDYLFNYTILSTVVGASIIVVLFIFLFKVWVAEIQWQFGSVAASFVNACIILIFNELFGKMATWMTDRENHRTQTEYEDHLIAKSFIFKFVNSYNSLFYIAFFKDRNNLFGHTDHCKNDDCLSELGTQLATVLIVRLVWGNFSELMTPAMKGFIEKKKEEKNARAAEAGSNHASGNTTLLSGNLQQELSNAEKQKLLPAYDDTFKDYDEMIIQYGYVTLFTVAFPLAPLLALLNNVAEIRLDAFKLTVLHRRPLPTKAEDIGSWYYILDIMTIMSVVTNVGVIAFTSGSNSVIPLYDRLKYFIIWEHVLLGIKFLLKILIPDVPRSIRILQKRHEFVIDKYIRGIVDDDEEVVVQVQEQNANDFKAKLKIAPNDDDVDE